VETLASSSNIVGRPCPPCTTLGATVDDMAILTKQTGTSDPVLSRMVAEDKVPWYRKPNLRIMYIYLFLCCMGVEMTSGFDSQLINTLQFSKSFNKCRLAQRRLASCC
jgi:hypothetical protein